MTSDYAAAVRDAKRAADAGANKYRRRTTYAWRDWLAGVVLALGALALCGLVVGAAFAFVLWL